MRLQRNNGFETDKELFTICVEMFYSCIATV